MTTKFDESFFAAVGDLVKAVTVQAGLYKSYNAVVCPGCKKEEIEFKTMLFMKGGDRAKFKCPECLHAWVYTEPGPKPWAEPKAYVIGFGGHLIFQYEWLEP